MAKTIRATRKKASPQISPSVSPLPPPSALVANGVQVLSGDAWRETVIALHAQVRAEMPESQRHFLLPKPPAYFEDLLHGRSGVLLGVMVEGQLGGFVALARAADFAEAHAGGRLTCPDDRGLLAKAYGVGAVGVMQSLCVLNAYLGRGLSRTLVQGAVAWCVGQRVKHVFAQIADQNMLSWVRFLDQDFAIVAVWESGHRRFLLRWLAAAEKAKALKRCAPEDRHVYRKDYAQVPALIAEIEARVEAGRCVMLDNKAGEAGAFHFVFGKGLA